MLMIYTGHLILFFLVLFLAECVSSCGGWVDWSGGRRQVLELIPQWWHSSGFVVGNGILCHERSSSGDPWLRAVLHPIHTLFHSKHHLHLLVGPITKVWSQALGHFQNCSIIFDPCFWLFITKLDTLNKIGYFLVFFFFVFLLWTICRSFSVESVLPLCFYSLFTVQVAALLHFQPCLFCAPISGKATLHTQSYIFNEQI